jgi:Zinc-binding dehydrogenase
LSAGVRSLLQTWNFSTTGSFPKLACVAERLLAPKRIHLTVWQAAAVPVAAVTALQGLRDVGEVQPGQAVLINGASGGVGTFAVQIAKTIGADVTGVCSIRNAELIRSLGADHVIDDTRENVTRSGQRYDPRPRRPAPAGSLPTRADPDRHAGPGERQRRPGHRGLLQRRLTVATRDPTVRGSISTSPTPPSSRPPRTELPTLSSHRQGPLLRGVRGGGCDHGNGRWLANIGMDKASSPPPPPLQSPTRPVS